MLAWVTSEDLFVPNTYSGVSAYERHKHYINNYVLFYGDDTSQFTQPTVRIQA